MGQQYPYSTVWVKKNVATLHTYGALTVALLFYNHQDTDSES